MTAAGDGFPKMTRPGQDTFPRIPFPGYLSPFLGKTMLLCALLNLLLMREISDGWLCHQKLQSVHNSSDSLVCSVTNFSFILNGTNFTQLPLNVSYSETAVNIPSPAVSS